MVHPLRLLWERLHHVRAAAETLPDRLRPAKSTVHPVFPLALIGEVVAVAAQEVAPRSVQDRNPSAASCTWTDEPEPLSTEVARRPAQGHGLLHILPLSACPAGRRATSVERGSGSSVQVQDAA